MILGRPVRLYLIPEVVCVLDEPTRGPSGEGTLTHYARSYYVSARDPDDAISLARDAERAGGATLLNFEMPRAIDARDAPDEVRPAVRGGRGVKWRSGRVFFPAS
jgi:hypothetical protein